MGELDGEGEGLIMNMKCLRNPEIQGDQCTQGKKYKSEHSHGNGGTEM